MTARSARLTTTVTPTTVTITGTVSDPSGYPLAGITVDLFEAGDREGARYGSTTTDDVGGYRFTRVPAVMGDDYRLEATDDSGAHVLTQSRLTVGPGRTTTHHTTMPVAGHIQGSVTTRDGAGPAQPASQVCVTAAGENTVQAAYVAANGRFRIGGLPAGSYTLTFEDSEGEFADQCYSNVRIDDDNAHATRVTVTAGRTTTIEDQVLRHHL